MYATNLKGVCRGYIGFRVFRGLRGLGFWDLGFKVLGLGILSP